MKKLRELSDLFKTLKHRSASKKYCPRCGSPEMRLSSSFDYWLTPVKYICKNCGYIGPLAMELEKEEKEQPNSSGDMV